MSIVLDESVPRELAGALRAAGCDVVPFPNSWKGTRNGALLSRVKQAGHTALLTCDKNMAHQQNLARLDILVAVLPVQRLVVLLQHVDEIARSLASASPPATGVLLIRFDTPGMDD